RIMIAGVFRDLNGGLPLRGESMSVRLRALGLVAAVALLSSGLLTESAGATTPQATGAGPQWMDVDSEPAPPPAPTNVPLISIDGDCVTIGWTGSTGAVGYRVYELTGGSRVRVAMSTTTTATICGLTKSTVHLFVVTAVDVAANESAPSNPIQVVLPPVPCD